MIILSIDTATNVYSIALAEDETVVAEIGGDAGPATSAKIPGQIEALLKAAQLDISAVDAYAVTVGPGAFTGVRVGIALVKGLAYSTGKPVIPLSSLELLALNAKNSEIPVCPMFDARKSEIYTALFGFNGGMNLILPETAIAPADFLAQLAGTTLFIGDGAVRYRELIVEILGSRALFAEEHRHHPQASAGAALALSRFKASQTVSHAELSPRYLRLPEAELNKK